MIGAAIIVLREVFEAALIVGIVLAVTQGAGILVQATGLLAAALSAPAPARAALDGAEQHKLDLEYSPTAWWRAELFGEWEKAPGESLEATEIAWENIFQLTAQGRHFADFGVLAEYAHALQQGGEDAIELGVLVEKQLARSIVTVNVLAERALASGADTELEYAARWRSRLSERFEPGVELHGELGDWGAFGRLKERTHELGPAMLGRLRSANGSGAFRYQAAVLFGLTRDSPHTTLRAQLEGEF